MMLNDSSHSVRKLLVQEKSVLLLKFFEISDSSYTGKHYEITSDIHMRLQANTMHKVFPQVFYFELVSDIFVKNAKTGLLCTKEPGLFCVSLISLDNDKGRKIVGILFKIFQNMTDP